MTMAFSQITIVNTRLVRAVIKQIKGHLGSW